MTIRHFVQKDRRDVSAKAPSRRTSTHRTRNCKNGSAIWQVWWGTTARATTQVPVDPTAKAARGLKSNVPGLPSQPQKHAVSGNDFPAADDGAPRAAIDYRCSQVLGWQQHQVSGATGFESVRLNA